MHIGLGMGRQRGRKSGECQCFCATAWLHAGGRVELKQDEIQ